jgi:hypothetical protein
MNSTRMNTTIETPPTNRSTRRRVVVQKLNRTDVAVVDASPSNDVEETCPVIRANQVFFAGEATGRLRVVFF